MALSTCIHNISLYFLLFFFFFFVHYCENCQSFVCFTVVTRDMGSYNTFSRRDTTIDFLWGLLKQSLKGGQIHMWSFSPWRDEWDSNERMFAFLGQWFSLIFFSFFLNQRRSNRFLEGYSYVFVLVLVQAVYLHHEFKIIWHRSQRTFHCLPMSSWTKTIT